MADRPIIFSAPMVRALLEGRKTQTRRILDFTGRDGWHVDRVGPTGWQWTASEGSPRIPFRPRFAVGDRLYVREAHSLHDAYGQDRDDGMRWGPWPGLASAINPEQTRIVYYREGFDRSGPPRWRPSIHMPRWASRLTLTVTDVRVQRLQEISEADARAEGGIPADHPIDAGYWNHDGGIVLYPDARRSFRALWDSLHGPEAWDANPWVVALTFTVQHGNIDQIGGAQ